MLISRQLNKLNHTRGDTEMTKMTQEELMEVLRKRIDRCKKDWNNLKMLGDERQACIVDGREKELQDILWMLEDIEIVK